MGFLVDNYSMKTLAEIAKDALELAPAQRLTLARILLDLSEPDLEFQPDAESAWEQEIVRRMDAVRAGSAQSRSLDKVFADLDLRFPS